MWHPFFKTTVDIDDIEADGSPRDDDDIHPFITRAWSFVVRIMSADPIVFVNDSSIGLVGAWIERDFKRLPTKRSVSIAPHPVPFVSTVAPIECRLYRASPPSTVAQVQHRRRQGPPHLQDHRRVHRRRPNRPLPRLHQRVTPLLDHRRRLRHQSQNPSQHLLNRRPPEVRDPRPVTTVVWLPRKLTVSFPENSPQLHTQASNSTSSTQNQGTPLQ